MKKAFVLVLMSLFFLTSLPSGSFACEIESEKRDYVIVAKNERALEKIITDFESNMNCQNDFSDNTVVLNLTDSEAQRISNYSGTENIENDIILSQSGSNEFDELVENISNQNSETNSEEIITDNIKMVNGNDLNYQENNSVKVAILDSGIAEHDELNVVSRKSFIPDIKIDNTLFAYDLCGHGTGIAGILGAKKDNKGLMGICENIDLYSIQVLDSAGNAPLSRIVDGIDWAIENIIDVINMSFGTNINSAVLQDAILRAYENGMILVASSGNTSSNTQYPARYQEVISVGSVNGTGNVSDFSANDEYVDVYAPGEGIITTGIINGYVTSEGTSLSAPHVTAAAAIIKMYDNTVNSLQAKNIIKASSNKIISGKSEGILDIRKMYDILQSDAYYEENQNLHEQNVTINMYDSDAIVEGNWSKSSHVNLITGSTQISSISQNDLKLITASAYMADELYGVSHYSSEAKKYMKSFYPLHAYGSPVINSNNTVSDDSLTTCNSNFLADTKYLFRLARFFYNSPSVAYAETQENIDTVTKAGANWKALQQIVFSNSPIYNNPTTYFMAGDERYIAIPSSSTLTEEQKRIQYGQFLTVKGIAHMNVYDGISENTQQKIAFKILGLAIHLAGDTYAHRTRVPVSSAKQGGCFAGNSIQGFIANEGTYENTTAMYAFLKEGTKTNNLCKCINCFKNAVSAGRVEFRDLSKFINSKKYNADNSSLDPKEDFYVKRYTIATKNATDKLLSRFLNNQDFTLFVFLPSDTSYTLKLNNLKGYMESTGMNWDGLQQSTRDRVTALSTSALI